MRTLDENLLMPNLDSRISSNSTITIPFANRTHSLSQTTPHHTTIEPSSSSDRSALRWSAIGLRFNQHSLYPPSNGVWWWQLDATAPSDAVHHHCIMSTRGASHDQLNNPTRWVICAFSNTLFSALACKTNSKALCHSTKWERASVNYPSYRASQTSSSVGAIFDPTWGETHGNQPFSSVSTCISSPAALSRKIKTFTWLSTQQQVVRQWNSGSSIHRRS
jgi:hypothetical protein